MYLIVFLKIFGKEQFTTSIGNEFLTGTTLTENKYFLVLVLNLGRISLRMWPRVALLVFNSNISFKHICKTSIYYANSLIYQATCIVY